MSNKNYLILLSETERSMIVEAMKNYIVHPFFGTGTWVSLEGREKGRAGTVKALEMINSFEGAIRKVASEEALHWIRNALMWYADYISFNEDGFKNEYIELAYIIEGRNKNQYLFNIEGADKKNPIFKFDPNNFNPKEAKKIRKSDFSRQRFYIVRKVDGKVDYVNELIQKIDESNEEYKKYVKKEFKKEDNKNGERLLITDDDINKFELTETYFYTNRRY